MTILIHLLILILRFVGSYPYTKFAHKVNMTFSYIHFIILEVANYNTMFESLSERLETAFKQLKGEGRITELNIAATIKEIRRALVDADVNYKIAKEFTDRVKEKAKGEKVINAISPGQLMVKMVKDELVELMGGTESEFNTKGSPAVILIAGLQGSGKTTFSGKLANYLKTRKGLSPLLVAADIYRPAAIEQLKVLGRTDRCRRIQRAGQ